jgi:outer membrane protein assembly factor BamD (BamD/ComL family)
MLFSYFVLAPWYLLLSGCTWDQFNLFKPPTPPPPVESFVLRNGTLVPEKIPLGKGAETMLAGARELFRREEYAKAERVFHYLADHDKNPPAVIQEALYYEAECLRLQGDWPKATDVYAKLVRDHTTNPYRDQALQHMFDIARFWLQDTWEEVRETQEKREGKRWVVWPRFISLDKRKPIVDREGRAIQRLEDVHMFEGKGGAYADKALFLCGYVKWYNEDYAGADHDFTQLHERFPESPYAADAVEFAIKAKMMSTGGADYDGRKAAEARKLVDDAMRMRQLNDQRKKDLQNLLSSISAQQAEKDFQTAEFYRRTGHPGSAYFCYEIVRRRYPGTDAAMRAIQRMMEIRNKMAKEQQDKLGPPPDGPTRPAEQLLPPRKVQPDGLPQPRPLPGSPETAPMPQKVPGGPETAPPPRPLPVGGGQ